VSRPADGPAGILFDIDGTLLDSVYLQVVAWQQVLARAGVTVAGWRIHDVIGLGMAGAAAALGLSLDAAEVRQLSEWHREAFETLAPAVTPTPGAAGLLEVLGDAGLPVALVTNGDAATSDALYRSVIAARDLPLVSATGDLVPKPAPDSLAAAAERIGVVLADCWVVGDTPTDMAAAAAAGATAVAVRTGGWAADALRRGGATHVVDDLRVVAAWLSGPAS
jgi:HAD superfamily hydrolase (TIGR01549 family)